MKTKKNPIIKNVAIAAIAVVATLESSIQAQAQVTPTWEQVGYYLAQYNEAAYYASIVPEANLPSLAYTQTAALGSVYYAPYYAYYSALAYQLADPYYAQGSVDYAYYTYLGNYYAALNPANSAWLLNYFGYTAESNSSYLYSVGAYLGSYYFNYAEYFRLLIFPISS